MRFANEKCKNIIFSFVSILSALNERIVIFIFKLGLEPYNGVGIIGFNSPEWLFSDLGAIYAG